MQIAQRKATNADVEAAWSISQTKRNMTDSTAQVACCRAPAPGTAEGEILCCNIIELPLGNRGRFPKNPEGALKEECSVRIVAGTVQLTETLSGLGW